MSMILSIGAIDDESIDKLLADPPSVWKVVAPGAPFMVEQARQPPQRPSFFARLFGVKQELDPVPPPEPADVSGFLEEIDLDKAWHGIHYLLTGTAWEGEWPRNFLLAGGENIGDIDVAYGPARAFKSEDVSVVFDAVQQITEDDLRTRFDPAEMKELGIYPDIWHRDPQEDDTFGYCAEYFRELTVFLERTSANGLGMIVFLS